MEEADRAIRIARILALAVAVFASAELGLAWLRAPLSRFDGAAPMVQLATDVGTRMVERLLIQIDKGYLA